MEDHNQSLQLGKMVKMQNFIFFMLAYCTKKVYEQDECVDETKELFLRWVLYGNAAICISLLIGFMLNKIPQIYHVLNKCGAVVVTIQAWLFVYALYIYHVVTMLYGIKKYFFSDPTECKELQLFLMVCAYIYVIWIFLQIFQYLLQLAIRLYPQERNMDDFLQGNQPLTSSRYH